MNAPVAGPFKPYIEGLVEQKRSIGYSYPSSAQILKTFEAFCRERYSDETR